MLKFDQFVAIMLFQYKLILLSFIFVPIDLGW